MSPPEFPGRNGRVRADEKGALFDRNPALSTHYEQGPRWFIPGYDASHVMTSVLLRHRVGDRGRILVIGAGGGVELSVFVADCQGWSFVAVDPSREMLEQARRKVESLGAASRVSWVEGYTEDAPRERPSTRPPPSSV